MFGLLLLAAVTSSSSSSLYQLPAADDADDDIGYDGPVMEESSSMCEHRLYNGICLPQQWPPRFPTTTGLPSRKPQVPPYIKSPPAVINVSLGRQLFVDPFLIDSMPGLQLMSHSATWEPNPVLVATEPWEASPMPPPPPPCNPALCPLCCMPATCVCPAPMPGGSDWPVPSGQRAVGMARPSSGGLFYDEDLKKYRVYYTCGSQIRDKPRHICHAESENGRIFTKPRTGINGTNIVYSGFFDGGSVWLDYDATNASERWKMVTVPAPRVNSFRFFVSRDGLSWSRVGGDSGPSGDRATAFVNRFRQTWVFSLKELWPGFGIGGSAVGQSFGRARAYVESQNFVSDGTNWSGTSGPFPWVGSDVADPTWNFNAAIPAELYALDVTNYESLLVGLFTIFRGFTNPNATTDGNRTSTELDELYLGYSRDGFHWWRAGDGSIQHGGSYPYPRQPFLRQTFPQFSWRRSDVSSVGGGFTVQQDHLEFYATGSSDLPGLFGDSEIYGGNGSMGIATLRRDGFVSVESLASQGPGVLTTRPLTWNHGQQFMFINAIIESQGLLQVGNCVQALVPVTIHSTTRIKNHV